MEDRKDSTNSHLTLPQKKSIRGLRNLELVWNESVRSISRQTSRFRHARQLHMNEVRLDRHRGRVGLQASGSYTVGLVSKIFVLKEMPGRREVICFDK